MVQPPDGRAAKLMRDAADIAERLAPDDERIVRLIDAGRFSEFFGEVLFLGGGTAVQDARSESVSRADATGQTVLAAVILAALRERAPAAMPKGRSPVPRRSERSAPGLH